MSVKVAAKILGVSSLQKKLDSINKDSQKVMVKSMQDATFLLHKTAIELVQDNSGGTPQVRYTNGRKRVVNASKPGDPPNTDTGRLVQSIKFDFQDGGLIGRVGTNLRYGSWLEFGTKDMAARPWLSTALSMVSKEVKNIFAKAVKDVFKGAGK